MATSKKRPSANTPSLPRIELDTTANWPIVSFQKLLGSVSVEGNRVITHLLAEYASLPIGYEEGEVLRSSDVQRRIVATIVMDEVSARELRDYLTMQIAEFGSKSKPRRMK